MLIGLDANEANIKERVGSNQFAFNILWQLYRQDKTNQYHIYLKQSPLESLPPATPRWTYRILTPGWLWTQWRLPLDLYLSRPQPKLFFSLGHYAPRQAPMPTMISIMDLAFLNYPQQFLKQDLFKLKHWTRTSAKKASHIFTISQHSKQDIIKHYRISTNKITVVYPGIDLSRFTNTNTKAKTAPPKQPYLLYLGTLQPRKNLINLIKAFHLLQPTKYSLIIAGKRGWLYKNLYRIVKQLKLQNKIKFLGYVKPSQVPGLIKQAQLLILPSLYEGFGIPVVQAMASRTPVLVARNSSLKEIVQDTGLYIEPPFSAQEIKQGIIKALSLSEQQKNQLINKAAQRSRQFSWEKAGQKILEVINELSL